MKTPKLTQAVMVAAALGAALMGFAACGGGVGASDDTQIRSLIEKEFDAIRSRNVDKEYAFYSARYREGCTKDEYEQVSNDAVPDGTDLSDLGYTISSVTIDGNDADVSAVITLQGEELDREAEHFVKEHGSWFDDGRTDDARSNLCGDNVASPRATSRSAVRDTSTRTDNSTPTRAAARETATPPQTARPPRTATAARTPAPTATSATTALAETAVRALFDRQYAAIKRKDWTTVYAQESPRARQDCTLEQFTTHLVQQFTVQSLDPAKIGYQSLIVNVTAVGRATLSFVRTNNGAPLQAMTTTAVNIGGTWYDDNNGLSACTFS